MAFGSAFSATKYLRMQMGSDSKWRNSLYPANGPIYTIFGAALKGSQRETTSFGVPNWKTHEHGNQEAPVTKSFLNGYAHVPPKWTIDY